jgi:hypothetical protein
VKEEPYQFLKNFSSATGTKNQHYNYGTNEGEEYSTEEFSSPEKG